MFEQGAFETFGSEDKYYTAKKLSGKSHNESPQASLEASVANQLNSFNPGLKDQVSRSFKRWNPFIRERLRIEMGLRLSTSEKPQAVPVKIKDGLPLPFSKVIRETTPEALKLYFYRPKFESTISGLYLLLENYDIIEDWIRNKECLANKTEIKNVQNLLVALTNQLKKDELLNNIKKIREDILGAYFFYVSEIQSLLYWMVIGLVARMIGVSVEGLTIVIAAHELAHAYSHLGMDIDNECWELQDFSKADLYIVEGLAQHYTEILCNKLESRYPQAKAAYKKLLKLQSEPYTNYKSWNQENRGNKHRNVHLGEVVRISMIKCRSRGIGQYDKFQEILNEQKASLKIWPRSLEE